MVQVAPRRPMNSAQTIERTTGVKHINGICTNVYIPAYTETKTLVHVRLVLTCCTSLPTPADPYCTLDLRKQQRMGAKRPLRQHKQHNQFTQLHTDNNSKGATCSTPPHVQCTVDRTNQRCEAHQRNRYERLHMCIHWNWNTSIYVNRAYLLHFTSKHGRSRLHTRSTEAATCHDSCQKSLKAIAQAKQPVCNTAHSK